MNGARTVLLIGFLALLLAPEPGRYAAERELARAESAVRALLAARTTTGGLPRGVDPARVLDRIATSASDLAGVPPGDSRALILAGSARLIGGQGDAALALYRRALERGERAEIVLNAGRAHASLGETDLAHAAFLRAGWISPEILATVPEKTSAPLLEEVAALAARLSAGELSAPPALPASLAARDADRLGPGR